MSNLYIIPDFTGYRISIDGKIYSLIKKGCRNRFDESKYIDPYELKSRKTRGGYSRVFLRRDSTGKREDVYIHRLIGILFIPNIDPLNKVEINHKDCNLDNNSMNNLEWVTRKENIDYGYKYGFMNRNDKGQFCRKDGIV